MVVVTVVAATVADTAVATAAVKGAPESGRTPYAASQARRSRYVRR